MKIEKFKSKSAFAMLPLCFFVAQAVAQEANTGTEAESEEPKRRINLNIENPIEEVLVMGRLKSAVGDVLIERQEQNAIADIVDYKQIARIGDPTVAAALRRVPGITLVNGKFVYVRGLGERYSSSTLNGAAIPSPDLTRSVIPLDIFPTSILQSLSVQKSFSADMPAGFGGGNIDIRTKGIPTGPELKIEIGTSYNSNASDTGLRYRGGGDDDFGTDDGTRALPLTIANAINTYRGSIEPTDILALDQLQQGTMSFSDAQQLNRQFATSLNRDVDVGERDLSNYYDGKFSGGTSFLLDSGLELGFLLGGSYSSKYKNTTITDRVFGAPSQQFTLENRTTQEVNVTGHLALGAKYDENNQVNASYIFLRNTDDEVSQKDIYNSDRIFGSGSGFRETGGQFEHRELKVLQVFGDHQGDFLLRGKDLGFLNDIEISWYVSEAEATTAIPGAFSLSESTTNDEETGEVLSSSLSVSQRMIEYRYTDLLDEVDSSGYSVDIPFELDAMNINLRFGQEYTKKGRTYQQTDIFLGSSAAPRDLVGILGGSFQQVFRDENLLNPDNGFSVSLNSAGARSYLAGVTNSAAFGEIGFDWIDRLNVVLGGRWEEYNQVGLPWKPYNFDESQITTDPDELAAATFKDDKIYPSLAATYKSSDFMGAETWQLRFSYSETVVRPDLREITETSYLDPLTDFLVQGNQDVVPSDMTNVDLRSEWFFAENQDLLSFTLFYKDIENPIEFFELPASDNKRSAGIFNAESSETYGIEAEWTVDLNKIAEPLDPFFVQGNITLSESETIVGDRVSSVTNDVAPMKGSSEYVVNLIFGFDSFSEKHAATLSYNVFGPRIFAKGRNGTPDAYEQPFESVDFTYSWYPMERATVKIKMQNLLENDIVIEQENIETFRRTVGTGFSLDLQWSFF